MSTVKFGTDGWRAVIAEDFTFDNVERVTQAAADYWSAQPVPGTRKKIIVGYDRRFLSGEFGRRVAEVFAGNGFEVVLAPEPTPTPAISFDVKEQGAVGGIMITASHNPPRFNGYKLKCHFGGPADTATSQAVESFLGRNPVKAMPLEQGVKEKRIVLRDVRPAHYAAVKKLVDFKLISRSGLRFAHEALFGVGAGCFEQLLAGTTCKVTTLNGAYDPLFGGINPEPIAKNYVHSAAYLRKHPHDLCLVTDGDADRIGGMDGRGNYLSNHQVICLLLHHYIVNRKAQGRFVKAITTTSMTDKMCAAYGLDLVEVSVGFKHMAVEMLKGGVIMAGEESGSLGFPGHIPERDGIAAGLMLLELLAVERVSINTLLARLEKQFGPHRYDRVDAHYPLEKRAPLMEYLKANPPARLAGSPLARIETFDGVKFIAQDTSWLMLRGSGTEPILRIYAESSTEERVRKLLRLGGELTRKV